MARIIYKEGLEGQNRLECIEGIEIELLNGQKALIYPKYAERALLEREKIREWRATKKTEIEALMLKDTDYETRLLIALGSPAAIWIAQFRSSKHGLFNLPSLLAAMELQRQKKEIDVLAETIEGADLLRDYTSYVWSCSRFGESYGWVASGGIGFASSGGFLYGSYLAVPLVLLDTAADGVA
jgi:hypothetical protein